MVMAASSPVAAADIYGGVYSHGAPIGITVCCFEHGPDLELGAMTESLAALSRWGDFRSYGLVSVNAGGGVSFLAAGLAWRWRLPGHFYLQPGLGGAVQNGSTDHFQATPDRLYLGSRYLFEPQGSLGYQVSPRWAVEASYVHLSHAHLAGPQNPGLDDLGVRAVYRFGR
jgi:hypothetical protein